MATSVFKKLGIVSLALVFVVFAGLGCAGSSSSQNSSQSQQPTSTPTTSDTATDTTNQDQTNALTFAKEVVNLYGTYSSTSHYSNLKELERFMLSDKATATEQFINDQLAKESSATNSPYVNVTTKASDATVATQDITKKTWTITVTAQEDRTIEKDTQTNTVMYTAVIISGTGQRLYLDTITKK